MTDEKNNGCKDCEAAKKARETAKATPPPPPMNGALLYYDANGKTYRPLAPGPEGSTLKIVDGIPSWVP
jgi:hypothetical protein